MTVGFDMKLESGFFNAILSGFLAATASLLGKVTFDIALISTGLTEVFANNKSIPDGVSADNELYSFRAHSVQ